MYMAKDMGVNQDAHEIIEHGIRNAEKKHKSKLFEIGKERVEAANKAQEHKIKEMHRKQDRRVQRQIRVKEQIKSVLRSEVQKFVVDRGEAKSPSNNFELLDIHQNLDSNKVA